MKKRPIEEYFAILILAVMALLGFGNVLARYIFKTSFAATEEVEINLFVWVTVLGIGLAFARGSHLGMTTLVQKFPMWLKKTSVIFSSALSFLLFVLVDYYTIRAIYKDLTLFHMRSEALNIPNWIYTIGIPIFSIFVFKNIVLAATKRLKSLSGGEG